MPRLRLDALDGLDPDDPAAVEDAMKYLWDHDVECTHQEVQEFLRKLKELLSRN